MADTKTADDLVYEVASILGKAVAGESLGQPEYETIDNKIDGVLSRIAKIVYIGDRDEIPAELFDNIALIVAAFAGSKFSNEKPDMAYVRSLEADLRYLVADDPTYQVAAGNYF
jgi:hypothetical protein